MMVKSDNKVTNFKQKFKDEKEKSETGRYVNYHHQGNLMLERAVCQGKLQLSDYVEKQRQHHQAVRRGIDDGESRTSGFIVLHTL